MNKENHIISKTIPCDTITPVSALLNISKTQKYYSLFESVTGGEKRGRYSILALEPDLLWVCKNGKVFEGDEKNNFKLTETLAKNLFDSFRNFLKRSHIDKAAFAGLPSAAAGIYGYMAYDMVRFMEKLPDKNKASIDIPDAVYFRPKIIIVFDNIGDKLHICAPVYDGSSNAENAEKLISKYEKIIFEPLKINNPVQEFDLDISSNIDRAEYYKIVQKAKEYIVAGDIFQIVPSRRFTLQYPLSPLSFYRSLRSINPSPYLFYVNFDDFVITGSSPEILVKLKDDTVTVRPIAGTRKRGATETEDNALEKELLADEKEIAEHLMLLDLGRNDVGRVAEKGTVKVTERMVVEKYSHVMHIVSNVEGKLDKGKDAIDALILGFPAGTTSGAPKIRAMEIIEELEHERRQFYAGTVGYFSANGDMDTCIALRTALIKDKKLYLQAGGGVVFDSTEEGEFQETENKAQALIKAAEEAKNYL